MDHYYGLSQRKYQYFYNFLTKNTSGLTLFNSIEDSPA